MPTRVMSAGHDATEMEEELDVALLPGDRRRASTPRASILPQRPRPYLLEHARVHRRVADDALAHFGAAGLELRLDQRDDVGARPQQRRDDGQDLPQRDERHVDGDDIDGTRQIGERQVARVEVLDDDDARIVAQRPVDLAVADVERHDARRAALQQDVGEAAGRRADVERIRGRRR